MIRLSVDFEFQSRVWWESGGQDLWDGITEGFEDTSVVVEPDLAASWLAEAEKLEGWNDGHEFAPHPIVAVPLDEDDPDY